MIERLVRLHIASDKTGDFEEIFRNSQPLITAFPGCERVRLLRCADQPGVYFTQSFWTNADALQAYRASDFFRDTWTRTRALFEEPAAAWSLEVAEDYL